jgi:predicted helicase
VFVTRRLFECCLVSLKSREKTTGFPLWVAGDELFEGQRSANMHTQALSWLVRGVASELRPQGDELVTGVFFMIYAQLHSPAYRERYRDFLQRGFPRVFAPASSELFFALAELGRRLTALHLFEEPESGRIGTAYSGPSLPTVRGVEWCNDTVWLDAPAKKGRTLPTHGTVGINGVPQEVWNFHIGGYRVCEKWLKDRKGRTLSDEEIAHYQKIVVAISGTIRLMGKIDEVIEEYGGWPVAFQPDGK